MALEQRARCAWCAQTFPTRSSGGKPQKFCKTRCRRAFHSAARIWAELEIREGRLSVEELRVDFRADAVHAVEVAKAKTKTERQETPGQVSWSFC